MKAGLCEVVMVIDKSGSMESRKSDAIGGFNAFIDSQKKVPGEAMLTLTLFSDRAVTDEPKNLLEIEPLNNLTYVPGGSTALFDGIGQAIDLVGKRLKYTAEELRPEKVIVVIITDGEENASRWYSRAKIKSMIEHQQNKYSWEFHFLGANQDAFKEASAMGIHAANTVTYNVADTYRIYSTTISSAVTRARTTK